MPIEITLREFDLKEAFKRAREEVNSGRILNAYWRKLTFERVYYTWPDNPSEEKKTGSFRFVFSVEPY